MKKLLSIIALATTLGNVQIDAQSKTNAHMLGTDPSTYTPTGAHMLGTDPSTYTPTNTHMLGTDPNLHSKTIYEREY